MPQCYVIRTLCLQNEVLDICHIIHSRHSSSSNSSSGGGGSNGSSSGGSSSSSSSSSSGSSSSIIAFNFIRNTNAITSAYVLLSVSETQVSHPYQTTGKITVL